MTRWTKGQSGNPGGRPKEIGELRELARTKTHQAIETLCGVMADQSAPASARVAASVALLDRGYGRPGISNEHDGTTVIDMTAKEQQGDKDDDIDDLEVVRRIAYILGNGANASGQPMSNEMKMLLTRNGGLEEDAA